MTAESVPAGAVLLTQGTWHGRLYLVRSGILSVDAHTADGKARHLARLVPGECAGEMSLLSGQPVSARVTAVTDSSLGVLRQSDFMELLGVCPTLARNVSVILSQRLSSTIEGDQPGFTRLIRLRLHPDCPPELAAVIARSTAYHLDRTVMVLDHLGLKQWRGDERLPRLMDLVSSGGVLADVSGTGAPRLAVTDARELESETWVRLEAQLPREPVFGLQITGLASPHALPDALFEAAVDLTLWPSSAGQAVGAPGQVAVLTEQAAANSRSNLAAASSQFGVDVVRLFSPRADDMDSHVAWIARHLAGLKVGLSLGGGGARGGAHLGVLRSLARGAVPIDYITGCSVGAGLAAGVAYGLEVDELITMLMEFAQHVIKYTIPRHSLLSSSGLRSFYKTMVGDTLIEDLRIPLAVVAADILQAREVVLDEGLLWKAVLASTSLPGIYPPVWIGEYCLVDGGVLDPVPAAITQHLGADVVIAVKIDAPGERERIRCRAIESRPGKSLSLLGAIQRSFDVMATEIQEYVVEGANVVISVETEALTLREFQEGTRLLPSGARAVEQDWKQIQTALPWLRHTAAPVFET